MRVCPPTTEFFQFASIGDAPQDKKYQGEPTRLEIGDRNVFRKFCTMNRGTVTGHGVARIGDDNLFMAYAHVAHDCVVGNKCVMANYWCWPATWRSATGSSWPDTQACTSSARWAPTASSATTPP